jgi:hypothetical protein
MIENIQVMQDKAIYWSERESDAVSGECAALHRRCALPGDEVSALPVEIQLIAAQEWS